MIRVTAHALERYRERVADLDDSAIIERLKTSCIQAAASFGAPYVRLPTGQRVVLDGFTVVTILPVKSPEWRLGVPKALR